MVTQGANDLEQLTIDNERLPCVILNLLVTILNIYEEEVKTQFLQYIYATQYIQNI